MSVRSAAVENLISKPLVVCCAKVISQTVKSTAQSLSGLIIGTHPKKLDAWSSEERVNDMGERERFIIRGAKTADTKLGSKSSLPLTQADDQLAQEEKTFGAYL